METRCAVIANNAAGNHYAAVNATLSNIERENKALLQNVSHSKELTKKKFESLVRSWEAKHAELRARQDELHSKETAALNRTRVTVDTHSDGYNIFILMIHTI